MIWSHVSHLKAGMSAMRNTKLHSFWTMSGVIIGVASVILVVGIGEGIKQQISGQLHHLGKNIITIRPADLAAGTDSKSSNLLSGFSTSGPLTPKDTAVVAHVKGVAASAPLTLVGGSASGDSGSYAGGLVIGTSTDLPSLLNQSMAYGSFWESGGGTTNMAVLGTRASEALFDEDVPLGRSFSFHGRQFIVVGIFNDFNTTPLSTQADFNNAIFIPYDVAESLTNNTAPTYEILARADVSDHTEALRQAIANDLNKAHGGNSGFSVLSGNQNVTDSSAILDLLTRLIAGVAAISLLVGEIGIMNVMMVSVAERTHEIGMRKAVGATNRQILGQFLVEAGGLSLIGSAVGIVLAYLVDLGLRLATNLHPQISWYVVVAAAGISLLVGMVFGSVPAIKAARKDPIQALRSE